MQDRYESHVRQMTADQYWRAVLDTGWLGEIPAAHHDALEARVREAFARNPVYAWAALAVTAFDSECIYGIEPDALSYEAQLAFLAQTTNDVFRPAYIVNEYVDDHIKVSFEHNGRVYAYDAPADSDYFDPGVIALINEALADSGTSKRLIALPAIDQMYHFVVVSERVYRRAEKSMLIPPPKYFIYKRYQSAEAVNAYLDDYYSRLP